MSPIRRAVPERYGSIVEQWASRRALYLDNLKVILIAGIIAAHAVLSYASFEIWPYAEMREATLSPAAQIILLAVVLPFGLLMVPCCSWSPACSPRPRWNARAPEPTFGAETRTPGSLGATRPH